MKNKIPVSLTIAGSDSGGGAGVQTDLKALSANGTYGASVITAVTARNTTAVTVVHEVPADIVAAQIGAVLSGLSVNVIKLGMLFSVPVIEAIAERRTRFGGPVVVDPVMIAKPGDASLQDAAVDALNRQVLPHASLLTPNLPEAACLRGDTGASIPSAMTAQGRRLVGVEPETVLVKGGQATANACIDVLADDTGGIATSEAPRVQTRNTHDTGCVYSVAIAALLAQGHALKNAVSAAHACLESAIKAADRLQIGQALGPVHPFHGQGT